MITGCYNENDVTPSGNYSVLRFEFPQGNNSWDKEIEEIRRGKVMKLLIGKDEYPSDIRDVQKIVELEKGIQELIDFDDNKLFPYISRLLTALKVAVNPSPMTFL